MENREPKATTALGVVEASAVPRLLASSARGAIVLECIARGAGATRWYALHDARQLPTLAMRLRPGSRVTFYFDERFDTRVFSTTVLNEILRDAAPAHDVIIVRLSDDGLELDVGYICGESDLDAYPDILQPGATLMFGPYPETLDDGDNAVTIVLPDADGLVRPHPY